MVKLCLQISMCNCTLSSSCTSISGFAIHSQCVAVIIIIACLRYQRLTATPVVSVCKARLRFICHYEDNNSTGIHPFNCTTYSPQPPCTLLLTAAFWYNRNGYYRSPCERIHLAKLCTPPSSTVHESIENKNHWLLK